MNFQDFEREEALRYRKGMVVELKEKPDSIYIIEEYDPMMVPPIWLVDDCKPRYPEELNLKSHPLSVLPSETRQTA